MSSNATHLSKKGLGTATESLGCRAFLVLHLNAYSSFTLSQTKNTHQALTDVSDSGHTYFYGILPLLLLYRSTFGTLGVT